MEKVEGHECEWDAMREDDKTFCLRAHNSLHTEIWDSILSHTREHIACAKWQSVGGAV